MASSPGRWAYQEGRLDNGLRVLTLEDHRSPLISVQVWFHVGSKDEDPQRQGFAHMFEHMMFRGTDRIGPQDHFRYLNRFGARVNGYTSFDETVYWEVLPASQLDLALWLEAERMGRLKINEEYFAAERNVVKEERRMRYLNRPYGRLYETLFDAAFKVHPYRWTPIGNIPHLNAATAEELRAFFEKFYVPNNATLVVVGDVRHDDVISKARQFFGSIPRRPDPPRVSVVEPPVTEARRVEIADRAPSPRVVISYHAPGARDPDSLALEILSKILSSGQSSRLYRQLVQGKEIAVSVFGSAYTLEQAGLFTLSAILKPEVSIEVGEESLLEEIRGLLEKGIDPAELEKARNQTLAEYVQRGETVQGRADLLGYAAVILGDPDRANTDLERTRALTAEQVMAVARRVFGEQGRVTVVIRPDPNPPVDDEADTKSPVEKPIPDLPPPPEMPQGKSPQPVKLASPVVKRLDNGLQVAVFADHSSLAVTMGLNMLVGAASDPPEAAGLAYVTANTLRRGTARHSGDELAEIIDSHGMALSESVDHHESRMQMWTLSEHVDLACRTLAEVVREPSFPRREVDNFVARAVAREKIEDQNPATIAARAIDGALFGDNPLARPEGGTSTSLKGITRDQVAAFHQEFFAPNVATLVFAGDITAERAVALAEECFGNWRGQASLRTPPAPPPRGGLKVLLVNRPSASQSEIRIGQVVPVSRRDPDYAAVRLLSMVFGESFSARIGRVLRIEKGLTYGARGYYDVEGNAAAFRISTFTRTEKTAEAIEAALAEVNKLVTGDVSPEELALARDQLIGGFQVGLETAWQIAGRWWDLKVWGLPEGWYDGYQAAIVGVNDPAALRQAAARTIDPQKLTIVVVGNGEGVREDLSRIGPVESAPAP
ncbi:MAG: pitrilysin family protein [Phycisphaerae bacterium]|nr:pitrilysin family protein [Phycisphaerae bacterium]